MPFTLAHTVAVLPLVRISRLDPTCLVIGSMAPDFEYFARGEQVSRISHTLLGVAVWCIPVTLLLGALWHFLVKDPVKVALPPALARRLAPLFAPWTAGWPSAVVSAALGAFTHLAWDGVTHEGGLEDWIPALGNVYDVPGLGPMALHRIIQHASTLAGLVILAAYIVRLPAREAAPAPGRTRVRLVLVACIVVGVAAMAVRLHAMHLRDPGSVIVGVISGVLAGTIVAAALLRAVRRQA